MKRASGLNITSIDDFKNAIVSMSKKFRHTGLVHMPRFNLSQIESPEFDYLLLMDRLAQYQRPRDKVTSLLRDGSLLRLKKGIYARHAKAEPWLAASSPSSMISLPILANMIYGPSYVSQEFALAHYGMIPEGVFAITSVTSGRNKSFTTPLGLFSYQYLPLNFFCLGLRREQVDTRRAFLIATPEKALVDLIYGQIFKDLEDLETHLFESLRIERSSIKTFRLNTLREIKKSFNRPTVNLLWDLVRSYK